MMFGKRKTDLTEGPLFSKILMFTLPLIASSILQSLFGTVDTLMVGRWGGATPEECELALAAVGSSGVVINLLIKLFMGISLGSGICIAQEIGKKQSDSISGVVHTSVVIAMISGVATALVGLVLTRPILANIMQVDPLLLDVSAAYLRAVLLGVPASMVYNYCAAMLRSSGDSARPLMFLTVSGGVNVVLNFFMIVIFRLGALGAGLATTLSNYLACGMILWYMRRSDGYCHLDFKKLSIDGAILKRITVIGLPAGVQSVLFNASAAVTQSAINTFSLAVVAGNAACATVENYLYIFENAFYHTVLTFVGQNYGAKKTDRVRRSILYCALLTVLVGTLVGGVSVWFAKPLIGLFVPAGSAALAAGVHRLQWLGFAYILCGLMEIGSGVMRGFGKATTPMVVSLLGACVLRILWINTLFRAFPTPEIVYLSYPICWAVTALAHGVCCTVTFRRHAESRTIGVGEEI